LFRPSYIEAYRTGRLSESAAKAADILRDCRLCPRECSVNRIRNERGVCRTDRRAMGIAAEYLKAPDYPQRAMEALKEMHRQVGDLVINARGIAERGILLRHLVMPGGAAGTRNTMRFVAKEISPDTYVNIMDQYHTCGDARKHPLLGRRITREEYAEAVIDAIEEGISRFDR